MRYMGGKFRQRKAIVNCLRPYAKEGFTYVEPFCGGMWSAAAVCESLNPEKVILNDINHPLMLLWKKCIDEGVEWLPVDLEEIERNYHWYKYNGSDNDPMVAWYGTACCFGGRWFEGVARSHGRESFEPQRRSTAQKANTLRIANPQLTCGSYSDMSIPDGSVVYCDPPYEGRKAYQFKQFDHQEFWQWVRELSQRCIVMTSCYKCPDDFRTVYEWGDTVTRHYHSKGSDGTNERLVMCDVNKHSGGV